MSPIETSFLFVFNGESESENGQTGSYNIPFNKSVSDKLHSGPI